VVTVDKIIRDGTMNNKNNEYNACHTAIASEELVKGGVLL